MRLGCCHLELGTSLAVTLDLMVICLCHAAGALASTLWSEWESFGGGCIHICRGLQGDALGAQDDVAGKPNAPDIQMTFMS